MSESVLFVCNMNSVRSPMAAALLWKLSQGRIEVDSAGVYQGGPDPFVPEVLREVGVKLVRYEPKSVKNASPGKFRAVIALTPEAAEALLAYLPAERIELWPIGNPSEARGGRDAVLDAYRAVRDDLAGRIRQRFPGPFGT